LVVPIDEHWLRRRPGQGKAAARQGGDGEILEIVGLNRADDELVSRRRAIGSKGAHDPDGIGMAVRRG
jgi:hypothetical protein